MVAMQSVDHLDMGGASDWLCRMGDLLQPIRYSTQICIVIHHLYGIAALISQTSFHLETTSGPKCLLFTQAMLHLAAHFSKRQNI